MPFLKPRSLLLFLVLIVIFGRPSFCQINDYNTEVQVYRTTEAMHVDGRLDEAIWLKAQPAKNFSQNFPVDSANATYDTEIYLVYDDNNLYVGVKCHSGGKELITPSLRRDFDFLGNDNISILFDTYNDNTNALVFGMTPFGVRREAVVSNSGQQPQDFDESWDNKWDGSSHIYDEYWMAEMAIPFNTLRFSRGSTKWRFNAYRYDTQSNEISSWINIPQNRFPMDLAYMGNMMWEEPIDKSGRNISIIPYTALNLNRDFENPNQEELQNKVDVGGDAKIGLTSGLNLDLTINPDFSQVEVDEQVTNLDRFEIFFPEKRQFFLENADMFAGFGVSRVNPFFSRRIGVNIDPSTGQNVQNRIHYGARISGKLNDNLRIGVLNMQTAEQEENGLPGFNYSVATAEQRISRSSRIAAMFVNKQATAADDNFGQFTDYNRVAGIEYRLNSPDNQWTGKTSFMKSFTPGIEEDTESHFMQLIHTKRKYRLEWAHLYIGDGFITETGFTPRKDFFMMSPEGALNFFPANSSISNITLGFDSRIFLNLDGDGLDILDKWEVQEINFEPELSITFTNFAMLNFRYEYNNLKLEANFDPTRLQSDDVFLPAGSEHSYMSGRMAFSSDIRKPFSYNLSAGAGSFYDGKIFSSDGSISYRYQPYGFVSLAYSYFRISLADPFEPVDLWLIGPRIDFTFSKKVFLTTFIQYNNQLDNLNVNARFQWRFAPVSDFFLVYTDNYSTNPLDPYTSRNRGLTAKLTYWLNL